MEASGAQPQLTACGRIEASYQQLQVAAHDCCCSTLLIDALRDHYGLPELLAQLDLARNSYFYHRARAAYTSATGKGERPEWVDSPRSRTQISRSWPRLGTRRGDITNC